MKWDKPAPFFPRETKQIRNRLSAETGMQNTRPTPSESILSHTGKKGNHSKVPPVLPPR